MDLATKYRHKRANPWLSRDILNNYKHSKKEGVAAGMPSNINLNSSIESNISDLTDLAVPSESSKAPRYHNKGGRPKGSTATNKAMSTQSKQLALNYAANKMASVKAYAIGSGNRVPKDTYDKIIFEAEEKWSSKMVQSAKQLS
jgi:hypothetical protein